MSHPLLTLLGQVTIFTLMFSIGVNVPFQKMVELWRQPNLLFRALFAVVVCVPLVVIVLLHLFHLPPEVMTGLALLAASPGAPLTTIRSEKAGGNIPYTAGLQLTLALGAVLITPLTLELFNRLFNLSIENVTLLDISRQITTVQLLPVGLGLLLQKFKPNLSLKIGSNLNKIATILLLILVIIIIIPAFKLIMKLQFISILAIIIMLIISLAIGHLLGETELGKRSALAIACIARNVGLALFIVILNKTEEEVLPTLVAYAIIGAIIGLPYSKWSKKQLPQ